ncbi:hypothetical protein AWV79_30210 [Cupriavidus sp. UYMMa02A]|nr:hypothetical protein AWV80_29865 [Cupriavidus sp. UYMU48A]ODV42072.1 hypothetical protein AWV79_30210 [Cupriavidus sp. UYMMa02A]
MRDITHLKWISDCCDIDARLIVKLVDFTAIGATLDRACFISDDEAETLVTELRYQISRGGLALIGETDGGNIVFFCMMIRSETPTCHHRAEVSKLAVHPAYRDQNIVLRAVRQIVVKADALGIEQLFLHVREGSATHLFWERFGFKSYGVLDDYARVGAKIYRGHFLQQSVRALRIRVFKTTQCASRA